MVYHHIGATFGTVLLRGDGLKNCALARPPRQNSSRPNRTKNLGAAMKEERGSIRTGMQGTGGGEVVAARERGAEGGVAGSGNGYGFLGALARRCAGFP